MPVLVLRKRFYLGLVLALAACAKAGEPDGVSDAFITPVVVDGGSDGSVGDDLSVPTDSDGGPGDAALPPGADAAHAPYDLSSPVSGGPSGTVDPTFGAIYPSLGSTGGEQAFSIATQSDGKVVAAGWAGGNMSIIRYTTVGALDTGFHGTGIYSFGIGTSSCAYAVAVQPDGKILAAGYDFGSDLGVMVGRVGAAGSIDSSFATSGVVTSVPTSIWPNSTQAYAMALQPDGKIVVAATANPPSGSGSDLLVLRYKTDGTLDTNFGAGKGGVTTDFSPLSVSARGVAIQPDGKIVVVGQSANNYVSAAAARYNGDGSLDTTFGTAGIVSSYFGPTYASAAGVVIQSSGRILLCGQALDSGSRLTFLVGALTTSGQIDTSYGMSGHAYASFGGGGEIGAACVLQSDDKIVVVGKSTDAGGLNPQPVIARFTAQGSLDTTFHTTGTALIPVPSTSSGEANAVALAPGGQIVVGGLVTPTTGSGFTKLFVTRMFP